MKTNQKLRVEKARAALLFNGLTIRGFARKHDYKPATVQKVLQRHFGLKRRPWGKVTTEILSLVDGYYESAGLN